MPTPKISAQEPTQRPFVIPLSGAEVAALAKYHLQHCRRLQRLAGLMSLGTQCTANLTPGQQLKALDECQSQHAAHITRRKALLLKLASKPSYPSAS